MPLSQPHVHLQPGKGQKNSRSLMSGQFRLCKDSLFDCIDHQIQRDYTAILACIILQHRRNLFLVVAGHAVRENGNGISGFCHIEAGGFHTGSCVCAGYHKLCNTVFLNKSTEGITGKCICFGLNEDIVTYNLKLRNDFCPLCSGKKILGGRSDASCAVLPRSAFSTAFHRV